MERERRYILFKFSDLYAALGHKFIDDDDLARLTAIGEKIEEMRKWYNKPPLQAVVVESDWPEYEPVWKMIEERMNIVN